MANLLQSDLLNASKVGALDFLLSLPDLEVDVKDKKGGGTALYLAAKKANRWVPDLGLLRTLFKDDAHHLDLF